MQFSAKIGWSAAGGMTLVAAVLAGLLWGRSQTTPTADAQSLKPWLQPLAIPQNDDSELGKQQVAAEIAEIRERVKINLFDNAVWKEESTEVGSVESQHSIPFLSKLPYINGRPGWKSNPATDALIQMVTPRIIIQEEDEDKLLGNSPDPAEKMSSPASGPVYPAGKVVVPLNSNGDRPESLNTSDSSRDEVQNFSFSGGLQR